VSHTVPSPQKFTPCLSHQNFCHPAYPPKFCHSDYPPQFCPAYPPKFCHPERGVRAPCERRVEGSAVAFACAVAIAFAVVRPHPPKPKDRHFDRSCSRLCEQRSEEIRFSTSTVRQSTPLPLLFLLSSPKGICCCLVFRIRAGLQPRVQPAAKRPPPPPKAGAKPKARSD
jgi:hypothetical protein